MTNYPFQQQPIPLPLRSQQDYLDQQQRIVEALAQRSRQLRQPFVQAGRFVVPMSHMQGLAQLGEALAAAIGNYVNRKGRQNLYSQWQRGRQKAIDAYMDAIKTRYPKTYGELRPSEQQRLTEAGAPPPAYTSEEFAPQGIASDWFAKQMRDWDEITRMRQKIDEEFGSPPPTQTGIPYKEPDVREYDILKGGEVKPSPNDLLAVPDKDVQKMDEYPVQGAPPAPSPSQPISQAETPLGPPLPPNPNAPIPEHLLPLVARQPSNEDLNLADMHILMNDFAPPALRQLAANRIQSRATQAMNMQNLLTKAQLDAALKSQVSGDAALRAQTQKDIAEQNLAFNREKLADMLNKEEQKLLLSESNKLFDRQGNFKPEVFEKLKALNEAKKAVTNIDLGDQFATAVIKPAINEAMKTKDMALSAVKQLETVGRMRQALQSGNVHVGPGSTWKHYVDQLALAAGIKGKNLEERVRNTRNLLQGLAKFTIEARKLLRGQGQISEGEQKALELAESGQLDELTGPELNAILNRIEETAKAVYAQHQTAVDVISAFPQAKMLAPIFSVPPLPNIPSESGKPWERNWEK